MNFREKFSKTKGMTRESVVPVTSVQCRRRGQEAGLGPRVPALWAGVIPLTQSRSTRGRLGDGWLRAPAEGFKWIKPPGTGTGNSCTALPSVLAAMVTKYQPSYFQR